MAPSNRPLPDVQTAKNVVSQHFDLMGLPLELRNMIYDYAVNDLPEPTSVCGYVKLGNTPPISRISRIIRHESLEVFFQKKAISIDSKDIFTKAIGYAPLVTALRRFDIRHTRRISRVLIHRFWDIGMGDPVAWVELKEHFFHPLCQFVYHYTMFEDFDHFQTLCRTFQKLRQLGIAHATICEIVKDLVQSYEASLRLCQRNCPWCDRVTNNDDYVQTGDNYEGNKTVAVDYGESWCCD